MNKIIKPAYTLFQKPVIDFIASKLAIMANLDENNRIREADEDLKNAFPRIGGSIKTTAEKLLQLFIKKWKSNGVGIKNNNSISFTYSYFIQHIDNRLQKTALKEHFIRLCNCYKGVLSDRCRGTLSLPGRIVNCITLEFSDGVIIYENKRINELKAMSINLKLENLHTGKSYPQITNIFKKNDARKGSTSTVEEMFSSFFKT